MKNRTFCMRVLSPRLFVMRLLTILLTLLLGACNDAPNQPPAPNPPADPTATAAAAAPTTAAVVVATPTPVANVNVILEQDPRLRQLRDAIAAVGLEETLLSLDDFTLLAPSDAAFAQLSNERLQVLDADNNALADVLRYHLIPQRLSQNELAASGPLDTVLGPPLLVNNAETYLALNNARVIDGDLNVTNGVVHIIDAVLTPPNPEAPLPNNLFEGLQADGRFGQFVAVLEANNLADRLRYEGPFTVLAPVDAAFDQLPPDTLSTQPDLILRHHFLPGRLDETALLNGDEFLTDAVAPLLVTSTSGTLTGTLLLEGEIQILGPGLPTSNGIIYPIEQVLLPPLE